MTGVPSDVLAFVRGETDPRNFSHREHVRMSYEILRRHSFDEAALHVCRALRAIAESSGRPQAFHQTITIAFLAIIAERIDAGQARDYERFACANPDLFDKDLLARWYRPERLSSPQARRTFLLPEPPL